MLCKWWTTNSLHNLGSPSEGLALFHTVRLTLNAGRRTAAPGQVPLAGDYVRAADVIPRLALIGQHAASHRGGVGWADPAKLNIRKGRAGVIRFDLFITQTEEQFSDRNKSSCLKSVSCWQQPSFNSTQFNSIQFYLYRTKSQQH